MIWIYDSDDLNLWLFQIEKKHTFALYGFSMNYVKHMQNPGGPLFVFCQIRAKYQL